MRKSLLALVCMALSSAAFAVTVNWQWKDSQITGWAGSSSAYMVYSQDQMTWQEVLSAAKSQPSAGTNVVKGNIGLFGHTATVSFDVGDATGSYYLYFALFDNKDAASATQYAVAQAGNGQYNLADFATSIPGPGAPPTPAEFLDPTWMAGNYKAAPEPTALALLALGVAGAALRRRIR